MKITVPVKDVTDKLYLHQFVGEGTYGDTEIELSVILPTMSPYLKVGNKRYTVCIHDIVKAIMGQLLKEGNACSKGEK